MAILNRDLDSSQQRDWISWSSQGQAYGFGVLGASGGVGSVPVGVTLNISGPMPYPYVVQSVNALSAGASGAPQLAFSILRPMVGGMTVIGIGISNMVITAGASFGGFGYSGNFGTMGYSGLAATGSTLLLGQRGDILLATTIGANTACTELMINLVVTRVQDTLSMDGI